ncbi:amidohydrolase family protein [Granulicella sp. L46]|jgi:L-fuconolactonase|uniref:amidohydrolase family protein n=1 Tax=Granulicella sp. L46 TaxID=1641865 RepID=UPI00131E2406
MALEVFRPSRLMFGSDWPVLLLASNYDIWKGIVERLITELSFDEQQHIAAGTAVQVYRLAGIDSKPKPSDSPHLLV